jgi:hypothetical protein
MTYDRGKNYWEKASEDEEEWRRQGKRRNSYFTRRIDGRRNDKKRITRYAVRRGLQFAQSCTEATRTCITIDKSGTFPCELAF